MIYFLIPVFNEAENIDELAKKLHQVLPAEDRVYVFVNDGSSDDTINILTRCFEEKNLHVLNNPGNQGPGYSFQNGFEYIINNLKASENDIIVTLEGDNTSDLLILPIMLELSKLGYDLVLASPYAQGGGISNTSFFRKVVSFFANMILRLWFDIKVLTLSSFYRVYSVKMLISLSAKHKKLIEENGFISKVEILVKAIKNNAKIIEVPMILDTHKRKGKSKMKVFKTIISYLKFFIKSKF
jgi:dolichol-phosphate mannosyltransferase